MIVCVPVSRNAFLFVLSVQEHPNSMAEWAKQQEENRRKMEIIDAMDRFPRALKVRV